VIALEVIRNLSRVSFSPTGSTDQQVIFGNNELHLVPTSIGETSLYWEEASVIEIEHLNALLCINGTSNSLLRDR
jgi:hypothetical protein